MPVVSVLAPPSPPSPSRSLDRPSGFRWPRQWAEQLPLLERQHDRLEALLAELLELYSQPLMAAGPGGAPAAQLALDLCCRRLLWQLRLHLRLEERWLEASGCLCPGHRAGHRDAARAAFEGYGQAGPDRCARLDWLLAIQAWFDRHRAGPDASAYALAAAAAASATAASSADPRTTAHRAIAHRTTAHRSAVTPA